MRTVGQARRDEGTGRQFFIDHNSRKTTWVRPPSPAPSVPSAPSSAPATPGEATPLAGMSPQDSSSDLTTHAGNGAGDDGAATEATAGASGGEPAAQAGKKGQDGAAGWGLFGLRVDEVQTFLSSSPVFALEHVWRLGQVSMP